MHDISYYLDLAKEITGSDYKTAQQLEVTRQYISNARHGESISDDIAMGLSEITGRPLIEIVATINVRRTKSPEMKKKWEHVAKSVAASLVIIVSGVFANSGDAMASVKAENSFSPCYTLCEVSWVCGRMDESPLTHESPSGLLLLKAHQPQMQYPTRTLWII